jgi:excisionase family DNA binding protein
MTTDKYLSIAEFAKEFKVSSQTVRRAIKAGRIQAFQVGAGKKAQYRISHLEIERIMQMSFEECVKNIRSLK